MKYLMFAVIVMVFSGCSQKTYYMMGQEYQHHKNIEEPVRQGASVPPEPYERETPSYEEYKSSIDNTRF